MASNSDHVLLILTKKNERADVVIPIIGQK